MKHFEKEFIEDGRYWRVFVEANANGTGNATITREYGAVGGKMSSLTREITKGKAGRTRLEQALLEARAMASKKEPKKVVMPMLAHEYSKHSHKMPDEVVVQPKIDGVRMVVRMDPDGNISMWSRTGKEVTNMEHLKPELRLFMKPGMIVDGEVYDPNESFNKISGIFRKNQTNFLKFFIFDFVNVEKNFLERFENFEKDFNLNFIFFLENRKIKKSQVETKHDSYVQRGYEGIMVRNPNGGYESGRSYTLMKYKKFHDKEFKIHSITAGKDGIPILTCVTARGHEFNTRMRGTREERMERGIHDIGKMVTVRYQELGDNGVPRFPVGISIRDYE